ncbi:MAG: hypothetical protein IJ740_04625 [Ruminococcus sp.]|nr:hypothetical protein [Ruminococcus sp.]
MISFALAVMMTLSLAGCTDSDSSESKDHSGFIIMRIDESSEVGDVNRSAYQYLYIDGGNVYFPYWMNVG